MDSDDKKIKQISRLLELGGTMLAQHCNTCGSPMFRYQGQVLCPVCQVMDEKELMTYQAEEQSSKVASSSGRDMAPVPSAPLPKDAATIIQPNTADSDADTSKGGQDESSHEAIPAISIPHKGAAMSVGMNEDLRPLKLLIIGKITEIASQIQDENDPRRIGESLELIERGLDIIKNTKAL